MATKLPVERIDIIEGPNLQFFLDCLRDAVPREGRAGYSLTIFSKVVLHYEDDSSEEVKNLAVQAVGIRYLGNIANRSTQFKFVITVSGRQQTFEGHYDTQSRKGSLSRKGRLSALK